MRVVLWARPRGRTWRLTARGARIRRVSEAEVRVVRIAGFTAAFVAALVLQRLFPHRNLRGSWRLNGGLWLVDIVLTGILCGACVCLAARWAEERDVGLLASTALPAWAGIGVSVLFLDLVSWGWHRANHRVSFLWRFHGVHHSDPTFTVSTALRFHPGELLLSLPLRLAAVIALGVPVAGVLVFEIAFTLANLIEHGDVSLPVRLERRLSFGIVTPSLHRRHHSIDEKDLNTNFGTVFSVWDRMFGTFRYGSSADRLTTGLPGGRPIGTLRDALLHPFLETSVRMR